MLRGRAPLVAMLLVVASCEEPLACVPGGTVNVGPTSEGCVADLLDHSTLFRVQMVFGCDDELLDCYVIEELFCGGESKADFVPIDLRNPVDDCPDAPWCVADCRRGLEGAGVLWDIPSVRAVPGCDVYAVGGD